VGFKWWMIFILFLRVKFSVQLKSTNLFDDFLAINKFSTQYSVLKFQKKLQCCFGLYKGRDQVIRPSFYDTA